MARFKLLTATGRIAEFVKRDNLYRLVVIPEDGPQFFADPAEPPVTKSKCPEVIEWACEICRSETTSFAVCIRCCIGGLRKHRNPADDSDFAIVCWGFEFEVVPDPCTECCKSAEFCDCGGDDES